METASDKHLNQMPSVENKRKPMEETNYFEPETLNLLEYSILCKRILSVYPKNFVAIHYACIWSVPSFAPMLTFFNCRRTVSCPFFPNILQTT